MHSSSSVESMYPSDDDDDTPHPCNRIPTITSNQPPPPTPCHTSTPASHGYVNVPNSDRRYENIDPNDPVVQRAREHQIAAQSEQHRPMPVYENL